jgi:hypothetical protein
METDLLTTVLNDSAIRPLLLRWARLQLAQDPQPHAFSQRGEPCPQLQAGQEQLRATIVKHLTAEYHQAAQAAKALATAAVQTFYDLQNPFALREMSLQTALGRQ